MIGKIYYLRKLGFCVEVVSAGEQSVTFKSVGNDLFGNVVMPLCEFLKEADEP